ncbi:MAG: hypothetical protein HYR55_19485 [Acidobacteria bacterium]|nr:hypothetical protein [Acidobacteriota bacterium]MBI3655916.1 hypothetical protein [Acidobacteriota bacterium]
MAERKFQPKKISTTNTKQEMIDAYNELQKQMQERREAELKPEEKIEERALKKVVETADALSTEGIVKEATHLRMEIGKMLTQLSDRLEEEVEKYRNINKAVEAKDKELQEIFEIQRSASSLAALMEAQHIKRQEFESEMASRKEELTLEIQTIRAEWEKEKKAREAEVKEREAGEQKKREREKEEYRYGFAREQQLAKDQFQDEKGKLEREIQNKTEEMEKELAEREKMIAQREGELADLQKKVATFPKEVELTVNKAVKEATEKVLADAKNKEELLKKEIGGERNVLNTRIASLEQTTKEQNEQIAKLSQQLEKAYSQVQDIAVKAIEGSSNFKSFTSWQQLMSEQLRKPPTEK